MCDLVSMRHRVVFDLAGTIGRPPISSAHEPERISPSGSQTREASVPPGRITAISDKGSSPVGTFQLSQRAINRPMRSPAPTRFAAVDGKNSQSNMVANEQASGPAN